MNNTCNVCLSKRLEYFCEKFQFYITSDCNFTKMRPQHLICCDCGLIQKRVDDDYLQCTKNLYENYKIYEQGDNEEQLIFDKKGKSKTRSEVLFENLKLHCRIKNEGNLAEIGCGFGKFLRVFNKNFPHWQLEGYDLGDQYSSQINAIDNATYLQKTFKPCDKKYDLIVGIHLLEHLRNPLELLTNCRDSLEDDGKIFMQFPNIKTSTFDLIIADHISHFSVNNVHNMALNTGLHIETISENIISKEIFCIFSKSTKNPHTSDRSIQNQNPKHAFDQINLLKSFETLCLEQKFPIKVFGSSIGASWLASYLKENLSTFIDEDISRVGNNHLGIKILPATSLIRNDKLLLPFPLEIANLISLRFADIGIEYIHPQL